MSGGTGDADLYVRAGSKPTTSTYDCRPYKGPSVWIASHKFSRSTAGSQVAALVQAVAAVGK